MKKRINDITFDPSMQPGHKTRYTSMQGFLGPNLTQRADSHNDDAFIISNDYTNELKYKSLGHPKTKPVTLLRKKGIQTF